MAAEWNDVKVLDVRHSGELTNSIAGEPVHIEVVVDTNGIGRDLGLEMVVYRQQDGTETLSRVEQFKVVKEEGQCAHI